MNYEIKYVVPTTDEDFYFLIPTGSKMLFRAIKVSDYSYNIYWVENNKVGKSFEGSYRVDSVARFVEEGTWVKQKSIPQTLLTTVKV
jgi:hypothetical protein